MVSLGTHVQEPSLGWFSVPACTVACYSDDLTRMSDSTRLCRDSVDTISGVQNAIVVHPDVLYDGLVRFHVHTARASKDFRMPGLCIRQHHVHRLDRPQ